MGLLDKFRGLLRRRKAYSVPSTGPGGWMPLIREPFQGAWQRNMEIVSPELASTYYADFACKTLIARDIAKLRVKLVKRVDGIWEETESPAFSPVLRKPNHFQTRNQFWENWILSKLSRGNTYVLKGRDNRGVVTELYVLDPRRVTPLIADDGSVFYDLATNELAGLPAQVRVPQTEIIHDRFNFIDHPLVGVPPIYASALAAMQGLNIQAQSARLFRNNATPSGIITAPDNISDDDAARFKADWENKFTGTNHGRVAILGGGVKFEPVTMTAVDGQLIEQLKWTAENVCSTYHVPPYKIGVGAMPSYNNVQALNVEYYTQCLQSLIEDAESCLDDALGLGEQYDLGVEFDVENLLRMDGSTQADFIVKLVGGGVLTPNEGRANFGKRKLAGGDTVYMQQQDIPMSVAAAQTEHPMAVKAQAAAPAAPADDEDDNDPAQEPDDDTKAMLGVYAEKGLTGLMAEDLMQ